MLINGPESEFLRVWLKTILQPLCDADPAALSKYVLALIKKDKPEKELRQSMIDQLDVFLQQETKGFVDLLFHTLSTKSYIPNIPVANSSQDAEETNKKTVTDPDNKFDIVLNSTSSSTTTPIESNSNPLTLTSPNSVVLTPGNSLTPPSPSNLFLGSSSIEPSPPAKSTDAKVNAYSSKRETSRKDDDKERETGRQLRKSRSPRRSPPRLHERRIRSRSPRDRDREQYQHRSRHRVRKSPPRRYERDGWDRRRNERRSSPARNRSASPRTRSPTRSYRRTYHSRSRSRSQLSRDRSRSLPRDKTDKKDVLLPVTTSVDEDMPSVEAPETKLQSVVRAVNHVDKADKVGYTTVTGIGSGGNDRCRDFDEKGLCMRGELCPFDHGKDPVVLEDISVSPNATPVDYIGVGGPNNLYAPQILRPTIPIMREYYPDNPAMEPSMCWGGVPPPFRPRHMGGMRHRGPLGGHVRPPIGFPMVPQRELINIPVTGVIGDPMGLDMRGPPLPPLHHHMGAMHRMRGMHVGRGRARGGFDHGRLGKPVSTRNFANCSLEVKKIPRELNNIMDLNSHFLRFGKIVNIQINFENDPEAALITFSSPLEANIAYRSTEAVLNNRFIRVFWHNKEKENEDGEAANAAEGIPQQQQQQLLQQPPRVSVKDRLGLPVPEAMDDKVEQEKILVSGNNLTKTVYNPGLLAKKSETASDKVQAVEAIKKSQEALANVEQQKKVKEESQRNALKLMVDLRKRKQDMLHEQIEQQKKLIAKLETCKGNNTKPAEKDGLMSLIKSLQESIEAIKKDLEDASKVKGPPNQPSKNKEEVRGLTQKEILDAELDLINKEQEGGDTNALQKKVHELRIQAHALGLIGHRGGRGASYRGRGGFSSRSRGAPRGIGRRFRQLRKVDRRTTTICVTGFPVGKLKEILAQFATFGVIAFYEADTKVPSLTIRYESRKKSEVAFSNGRIFDNMKLDIQWVVKDTERGKDNKNLDVNKNGQASNQDDDNSGSLDDEEMSDIYADELLFQYDEDEEEDERSWRR